MPGWNYSEFQEEFLPAPVYQKYFLCAFFSPAGASYIESCSSEPLSLSFIPSYWNFFLSEELWLQSYLTQVSSILYPASEKKTLTFFNFSLLVLWIQMANQTCKLMEKNKLQWIQNPN